MTMVVPVDPVGAQFLGAAAQVLCPSKMLHLKNNVFRGAIAHFRSLWRKNASKFAPNSSQIWNWSSESAETREFDNRFVFKLANRNRNFRKLVICNRFGGRVIVLKNLPQGFTRIFDNIAVRARSMQAWSEWAFLSRRWKHCFPSLVTN